MDKSKLSKIKAFVFDVDGVFTDGGVLVCESGDLLRTYNSKDGYAVRVAVEQGYRVGIITGGSSETIPKRFHPFGVFDIYLKARNKLPCFHDFCNKYQLRSEEILFMGDDIPDLEIMRACGFSCCPSDAVSEIKEAASYVSEYKGGAGCVREAIEQVMRVQGKWTKETHQLST